MLKIKIYKREDFSKLENPWKELYHSLPNRNFQFSYEWFNIWMKHFGKSVEPIIIAAIQDGVLVGVAPLMISLRKIFNIFPIRRLSFLANFDSDFSDFITADEFKEEFIDDVILLMARQNKIWDEFVFKDLIENHIKLELICEKLNDKNIKNVNFNRTKNLFISTKGRDWNKYYINNTSKNFVQRDIKRLSNIIAKHGEAKIVKQNELGLEKAINYVREMHVLRQSELGRQSKLSSDNYFLYFKELLKSFNDINYLDLRFLSINNIMTSYIVGFIDKGIYYYWNIGFNPIFSRFSPSKYLLYLTIKECFARDDIIEFNFMRGESEYKFKWTQNYRLLNKIEATNPFRAYTNILFWLKKQRKRF